MRKYIARLSIAVTLSSILTATAGCGPQVDGTAVAGEIDVRTLDVGKLQTLPVSAYYQYKHSFTYGQKLAAMRLADHLVLGTEVDPSLKYGHWSSFTSESLLNEFSENVHPALKEHRMQYGFSTGSTDKEHFDAFVLSPGDDALADIQRSLQPKYFGMRVMQFPDESSAKLAAESIETLDFNVAPDQNQKLTVDRYPTAHAHWRPGVPSMAATIARGSYVIDLQVGVPTPDLTQLADLAARVFDAQLPRLDRLPPLTPMQILMLDNDPAHVLERALNLQQLGGPEANRSASYGLQGFLHVRRDEQEHQSLYQETGVEHIGIGWEATVFQARDAAAAERFQAGMFEGPRFAAANGPLAVPSTVCVENKVTSSDVKRFSCSVRYRQYVAVVSSHQINDAYQRSAAQYAVFANAQ
ncbi:hypothetical protein ACFQ9R_24865 [Nocardia sp. NPDC056541]|uniref:DUF7373 family lipoprotein n=1 Tax=Nocardia sp. NPDC056541 TaxID=3345860 RepID=UPI00366AF591